MAVGTPPQLLSLRPLVNANNTSLFGAEACNSPLNARCSGERGGLFDFSKSSSLLFLSKSEWNSTSEEGRNDCLNSPCVYFEDDLSIEDGKRIHTFPMQIMMTEALSCLCSP
jgi:hypothetical protein